MPVGIATAALLLCFISPSVAEDANMALLRKAVEKAKRVEGNQLSDYSLIDQDEKPFNLSDYRGKPLLVSFIYTTCPDICNSVVASLVPSIEALKKEMGNAFNAVVVGFDAEFDTPEMMKAFGDHHEADYSLLRLASGDEKTIAGIVEAFGFFYDEIEEGGFSHLGVVTVVDDKGVIYDQIVKTKIEAADLRAPLKQLLSGERLAAKAPTLLNQLKALCLRYDPETGEYVVDYAYLFGVFLQALVIFLVAWFYLKEDIKKWYRKKIKGISINSG